MSEPAQSISTVRLTAGDAELTVLPDDGCRIGSLRIAGTELLRTQSPRPHGYGSFPMVPFVGRTANGRFSNGGINHQLPLNSPPHAIHGTGVGAAWRQVPAASTESSATFTYDLADPWPYTGRVTQVFELTPESISLALCVETFTDSFPAQAGWHPWFRRHLGDIGSGGENGDGISDGKGRTGSEAAVLDFSPEWQEERGDDHMPTGRRIEPQPGPWDDCFGMPDGVDATLTWPGRLELRITSPAQWVVVYDQQADALCVEPQSGPPNGLNSTPRLVTPIDPLEVSTTWHWRTL